MRRTLGTIGLALGLLAGCAGGDRAGARGFADELRDFRTARAARAEAEAFVPTRAGLAAAGTAGSVLLLTRESTPGAAVLIPEVGNDGAITWAATDGTVDLRGGVVSATRGLGFDLVSAETAQVRAAMAKGGGAYVRTLRDLDGEGVLRRIALDCRLADLGDGAIAVLGLAYPVRRYAERCEIAPDGIWLPNAPDGEITNVYAVDRAGTIRASRQWAAPRLGYLLLERTEIATD